MSAEDSLRHCDLEAALEQLQNDVRAKPADAKLRVFLFQLLVVMGQWDRALRQLNVAGELDAGTLAMVQTYREALQCEGFRSEVFAGRRSPLVFGEPPSWIAWMMEATRLTGIGKQAQAAELRARALAEAPATSGSVNGEPFEWIADADSRLGPVIEVIVNGAYYWAPIQRIRAIEIEEPTDLRDMVWTAGYFTWSNGGQSVGLIPTRYPGSESHAEGQVRMARQTVWDEVAPDSFIGLGQRILATDTADYPLMDVREITLNVDDDAEAGPREAESEGG